MELWVAGVILLVLLAGILVLILCGKKIHKGLRIVGVCVLGALFAAVLGYIALTFLFWTHWILLPWMSLRFPEQCYLRNRLH